MPSKRRASSIADRTVWEEAALFAARHNLTLREDDSVLPGIILINHADGSAAVHPQSKHITLHENTVRGSLLPSSYPRPQQP